MRSQTTGHLPSEVLGKGEGRWKRWNWQAGSCFVGGQFIDAIYKFLENKSFLLWLASFCVRTLCLGLILSTHPHSSRQLLVSRMSLFLYL